MLIAAAAAACASSDAGPYDYGSRGALLYQEMCEVCHGETGEGGLGPVLRDTHLDTDDLAAAIEARMPANAPGQCTGECAAETAKFIREGLTSSALRCDAVRSGPRRLRLLTRREYRATVRDLFGPSAPAMSCARATDCAYRDTCDAGTCEAAACDAQTFVYDPQGRPLQTVHVAGTFNGWSPTIAGGGFPLVHANGVWSGTFAIGEGRHQYKLVLNQSEWVSDPRAPGSAPDGFGGQNSVVELSCAAQDPISKLPVETRPARFPFDTDADSALVTAAHVDAYLAAAEQLADAAAVNPGALLPCNWSGDRAGCGRRLVAELGRRAFRRPLADAEVARYTQLIDGGADARAGVATALHAMLMSPAFLYRSELGEPDGRGGYRLTQYEIAAALSYALLGTTPGAELLDAAERRELDAAGIERWARRLLADPRARDQIGELVLQWIGGQAIATADKRDATFTAAARTSLANETRLFAADVVFDGSGRFGDLIAADYTVLDGTAAQFYGVSGQGRVTHADGRRAGVLGHASLLATTAHSDQTSPVLRGLRVRRNLLCEELPPPPPFAGGLPPVDPSATTRDRFAMHSSNEACSNCHRFIDGVGFGFERFDPVGRWRTAEGGRAIVASGDLDDVERLGAGTSAPFQTLPELARTIAGSDAAQSCFVRQYLRFARGLRETLAQRCGRLWIEDRFRAAGTDVRELLVLSVLSPDFVERR